MHTYTYTYTLNNVNQSAISFNLYSNSIIHLFEYLPKDHLFLFIYLYFNELNFICFFLFFDFFMHQIVKKNSPKQFSFTTTSIITTTTVPFQLKKVMIMTHVSLSFPFSLVTLF